MGQLYILEHPLLTHKLSVIRDKDTPVKDFREIVSEIAMLMCYEATKDLQLQDVTVNTPIALAKVKKLATDKITVIPILRAGLGMLDGMLKLLPFAKVGHIGLRRDETTLQPVEYYCKLPENIADDTVLITDPMLATGGSASAAISFIKKCGCKNIKLLCVLAAPEGVKCVMDAHSDIDLYVASLDEGLNERGYIVPGLGDAGDRIFGTI